LKFGDRVGKAFQDLYASIPAYNSEEIKINLKMYPEFPCQVKGERCKTNGINRSL